MKLILLAIYILAGIIIDIISWKYIIPPMGIFLKLFFLVFFASNIEARPISYNGGKTVMVLSDNMKNSIYYHYSPTYKYSIGIEVIEDTLLSKNYSYIKLTYLLNRKNTKNSQRNLYLQSGISPNGTDSFFYNIHGDWETRRVFSGFSIKRTENNYKNYTDQFIQLGFSPYLGEYGDLHSWIMVKSKKNSLSNSWSSYPVLKFFKGDFLFEFGFSNKTEWDAHLMYRF